jgi:hypothetical protein
VKRDALKIFNLKDFKTVINSNTCQDWQEWAFPAKFLIGLGSDDLDRIASRVVEIYKIDVGNIILKGQIAKKG